VGDDRRPPLAALIAAAVGRRRGDLAAGPTRRTAAARWVMTAARRLAVLVAAAVARRRGGLAAGFTRRSAAGRRLVTPRRLVALIAAPAVLVAGCGFRGLYDAPLPGGAPLGDRPYRVSVEFADVLDLVPQSAVKVNDVAVGRVERIELAGWHARVRVAVRGDVTLPANARAELRQSSLLGEKYVSLGPPTGEAPTGRLADGAVIPLAHSGRNPEVEEVLSALALLLNGGGLPQLRTINRELGQAMQGREPALRATLAELRTLTAGLDRQRADIVRAIDSLDRLTATVAARRQVIATALDTLPGALTVLADQRAALTRMLVALDNLGAVAVRVIEASRDDTVAALHALRPTLTQLAAAGRDLPNALELLVTYPFPRAVSGAVRGDYTNLSVTADLSVADLLGNLLGRYAARATAAGRTGARSARTGDGLPLVGELPTIPGLPALPGVGG
jgi:phospholipid/cholesterol/gamma-HCH transport system substrate-binding protein